MYEFLKKALKFLSGKFINFLLEVWKGTTGEILDNTHNYINEVILNVENISKYVITHKNDNIVDVAHKLRELYGYKEITIDFIVLLKKEKEGTINDEIKTAKLNLAYKIITNRLKAEKVNWKENVIMLGIQLAVNRFFK